MDYTPSDKNVFTRCLSDSAVAKFKEAIPSVLNKNNGIVFVARHSSVMLSQQQLMLYVVEKLFRWANKS